MTSLFILLLLSHALADFIFQTGRLYQWKVRSNWGIAVHVLIFSATAIVLTAPLILQSPFFIAWLMFATLAHFVIDKTKIVIKATTIQAEIKAFIFDQIAHIAVIMTVYWLPIHSPEGYAADVMLGCIALFLSIYVAYAVSVLLYYYDRVIDPSIKRLDYQWKQMLYRLFVFGLLLTAWRPLVLVAIIFHGWRDQRRSVYDARRFGLEYCLLFILWFIFEGMKRSLL